MSPVRYEAPKNSVRLKKKETPKLCGHRLFKADRARLRRIAQKLRKCPARPNESDAVRIAIKDLHDKMFPAVHTSKKE